MNNFLSSDPMEALRNSLTRKLFLNPPEGEDYENREDYSSASTSKFLPDSIDYVNKAYSSRRMDALRAMDKFMAKHDTDTIWRACSALRVNGVQDTDSVLTDDMLEATERVVNNLRLLILRSRVALTANHAEKLKERAIQLLMEDLAREERIVYLVLESGVTDPEQLAIRVREMDHVHISLIDGSL